MSKYTDWLARTGGARRSGLDKGYDRNAQSGFEVTFDALEVPGDDPPPEIDDELLRLTIQARSNPTAILPRVRELLERYPDEQHLLNKLASALAADGQMDEARAVAERNYLKNPHYLFARLNYAEFLLDGPDPDRIIDIFGGTFNLRAMYPHRTVFHATEVSGVMSISVKYHLLKTDAIAASAALSVLREVDPEHPTLALANEILVAAALQGMIERVRPKARAHNPRKNSRSQDRRARKQL